MRRISTGHKGDPNEFLLSKTPKKKIEALKGTLKEPKKGTESPYTLGNLTPEQRERRRKYKLRKGDV